MKTGRVAKLFGVDPNTIANWTKEYAEFFTKQALGEGNKSQRDYLPEDLIILNTIRSNRRKEVGWEEIRAKLASSDLDTRLPPEATTISGENAMSVYSEMSSLRVLYDKERERSEWLESELQRKDQELQTERQSSAELVRQQAEEIGKWKALAELFERMWKEERDGK